MTHHVPVPAHPQPPVCSCGWTPALPWRCCWEQWDADTAAHLATVCAAHDTFHRDCPSCRRANVARGWATRRAKEAGRA